MSPARAEVVPRRAANRTLLARAAEYEHRFRVVFETFVVFPESLFQRLQTARCAAPMTKGLGVVFGLEADLSTLTRIANLSKPKRKDREDYLRALVNTYRQFPDNSRAANAKVVTVAPKREGMILAREVGWLPRNSLTPQMKRIPLKDGLAVGVAGLRIHTDTFDSCRVIDGAVASGATAMALMELMHQDNRSFEMLTVHATPEGLDNLYGYAQVLGTKINIRAGFVTGKLNGKYYAVDPTDHDKCVVGDLGDTIAPLIES